MLLDATEKPEFSSATPACAERETDVSMCHEPGTSSEMLLGDLSGRLAENGTSIHADVKQAFIVGSEPNASSSDNSTSHNLASTIHDTSGNSSSDEAVDLTSYVRTWISPTMKRNRQISNSARTVKEEFGRNELAASVPVDDIDNCSDSSNSIVYIKDEASTADADIDWASSISASIPQNRNSFSKHSYQMAPCSLDYTSYSSSVIEDATNASSDQVVNSLIFSF